ncbi:MAG: alcohol dehydrogenase catalytic domain-containing protein [Deltaproteobacteria bacterium]|nr:alcohol dehydrogenase catalytic domain-containing protein [Deltaproteobacteria bacterium]
MIPSQMRAAVVTEPNEIVVKQVEVPRIGRGDILIRIKYCGICGTDVSILHGIYSSEFLPLIPGHEFVGHVAEVGDGVDGFEQGQPVTADINLGCGRCFYCRRNAVLMCRECRQVGIHTNGAFAEYVSVPASHVYPLSSDMPLENGALIEPVSNVVRAAKMGGMTIATSVAVIGAGPAGLLHVQMARNHGAAPIIVVGKHRERLEHARRLGADFTVLAGQDAVDNVKRVTDGRGADFVIVSVGKTEVYEEAFRFVRPGGRIMAFGIVEAAGTAQFRPFQLVLGEMSITGSCAGMGNDFFEALTLVRYNRFSLEPFTHVKIPLENIQEGFDRVVNDRATLKVLISMD